MAKVGPYPQATAELLPPPDHLSYSQVTKLSARYRLSCPRSWAYSRLMGLWADDDMGTGLMCGKSLDAGAAAYLEAKLKGADDALCHRRGQVALDDMARSLPWPKGKADAYREAVAKAYDALVAAELVNVEPASVQQRHEYAADGTDGQSVTVVGYSDWITRDGRIVDLKWSGSKRWADDGEWDTAWLTEKRDQQVLYWQSRLAQLGAFQRAGGDVAAMLAAGVPPVMPHGRLVVVQMSLRQAVPQVRAVDFTFTTADAITMADVVREADALRRGDRHPARPGDACQWCPAVHRARCKRDSARLVPATRDLLDQA